MLRAAGGRIVVAVRRPRRSRKKERSFMKSMNKVMRRAAASAAVGAAAAALTASAVADPGHETANVAAANTKSPGVAPADVLTTTLEGDSVAEVVVAQGSYPVENPLATVGGVLVKYYGYYGDGPMVPAFDKNTYLVLKNQHGPDIHYDYGTRFLFQGHERGKKDAGGLERSYITRVNLDADIPHRVTLLAVNDSNGAPLPVIDGSTWDPFAQKLIFTAENTNDAVLAATPDYPSTVVDISGAVGRGGYEGVQVDSKGELWIVEDIGGSAGAVNTKAKQPNSFLYRFVPTNAADLTAGKLQVLQATSKATGQPILFHPGQADADILSTDVKDLHTYGNSFATKWVTIHDTAVDGTVPFNANALAKVKGGTPFKRPENGVFRPGRDFREFFFTETGDTNALTQAGAAFGGFGALFKLSQDHPEDATGTLTLFYDCDVAHTGFDNISFLTGDEVLVVEDAGDTLHTQRNALDSMYLFDTTADYSVAGAQPIRVLAEGRDASATIDSALSDAGTPGYQNEGDQEITGIHVSDGDASVDGLFGKKKPNPFHDGWRIFFTHQHGDNVTSEIVSLGKDGDKDDDVQDEKKDKKNK
jgi:hypothetical protein